jgi:hypothetical protein
LRNDPGEQTDLANKEPQRVAQMRARLRAWHKETGARFLRQKGNGPKPWHPDGAGEAVSLFTQPKPQIH